MPDYAYITDKLLDLLSRSDNDVLDEESDEPMRVGVSHGDDDGLNVSVSGIDPGGESVSIAKYRVTVERVIDDA